ncbi:MAG: hypothetical protein HYV07_07345 [Deltaproteobacteria bacterium]|nr:hypothetical protein [Deltaproteobacteria bacterium]
MKGIVLDAGALIGIERGDRILWGALRVAARREIDVIVPTTALAQVWRASRTQALLSKALGQCVEAGFDSLAREVGELCARARTRDVCDAHVALVASRQCDVLYTSDPVDMRRLLKTLGSRVRVLEC